MEPLVSILIPVFNHSKYILECMNSISKIDYPNIELVICDDGSTDDSYSKVKKWLASNPSVNAKLFTQKNQGVCKTLNRLIKESSGEYIALCASDDCLTPDSIKLRVLALQQQPHKLAVIGDALLIDQESNVIANSAMQYLYKANFSILESDLVSELIFRWSVVGPTLLIKREAYSFFGTYDENLLVEDREFYLRLLEKDCLFFFPNVVAKYRVHQSNSSRRSIAARLVILNQVALSNLKHANNFHGIKRVYLHSYIIDYVICSSLRSDYRFYILQPYRAIRKFFVLTCLKIKQVRFN